MNLRWKFWKRSRAETESPAQVSQQPDAPLIGFISSKELLGLQRLVGNQAVLKFLTAQSQKVQVPTRISRQPLWRRNRT